MAHHTGQHHFAFILVALAFVAFYVLREFLQASAGRWGSLAERYASSTEPEDRWERLPFLWVEWTKGRILCRASYGRSRIARSLWGQFRETLFPTLRIAVTRHGLHLRRQPWHFKHPQLLIPWKAVSGFQVIDGSEALTSHSGSLHPAVGAAIQARLPGAMKGAIKGALDSAMGDVARIELKEPKMLLLLPESAIGDVTRYVTASTGPSQTTPIETPTKPAAQPPTPSPKAQEGRQTLKTAKCGALGHPEFTLVYDPRQALERDVRWYAGVIEQKVQSGSRFKPGQSLQLGWSVARVTSLPDGTLGLEEYDLKGMPPKRQVGVTESLRVLRLQKDTLESVLPAKSLSFALLNQSCIVCTRLARSKTFVMQRDAAQGEVSGWFIGCTDSAHDHNDVANLKKVSVYEAIVVHCRAALSFLAFPPGAVIGVDKEPEMFLNGERLAVRSGSYLDRALPKRAGAAQ